MINNPHIGESFESFLRDEGIHDEVVATAIGRALALQAAQTKNPAGLSGVPGTPLSHPIGAFPNGRVIPGGEAGPDPFRSAGD